MADQNDQRDGDSDRGRADRDQNRADREELPDDDPGERFGQDVGEVLAGDPSAMTGMIGHFYRGQLHRATTWRGRLDQTSYWAVTVIAALLTWVFSSPGNPHYLLLIGMGAMVVFLGVETRRYRAYDVWRERVRLLEQDLFAGMFDPESEPTHPDWRQRLAADLRNPAVKTPMAVAFARRLRRIYYPLLLVVLASWLVRISVFQPKETWRQTARIFGISGVAVVAGVGLFYLVVTGVVVYGVVSRGEREFHERENTDPWRD
ncbi:DUF2270 domain-containing protein [Halorussus gelatinilyticus]|uniref:DUF2270 domain-containing protein n=1 Tax=Halorussus gelatinilyticus TaxID=2937524 RepID=A0A8U0IJK7_9EURY|nr:DUF2270 domain-containing protein [Halorussus gelatinilyticus]UPW01307.1 DUF2270 domain-containing protein [Halorussus gelatinilyticus]